MNVVRYFPYLGPSRRADCRVVEIHLNPEAAEPQNTPKNSSDIHKALLDAQVLKSGERFPEIGEPQDRDAWFAFMLAQLSLLFQQKTGHRVSYSELRSESGSSRALLLVEHEHCDVGMNAVGLAVELMTGNCPDLIGSFRRFSEFARQSMLPLETEALIKAAQAKDIPVSQLDRQPLLLGTGTTFRVRPNGLVRFGHGAACNVLDGSYCINRSNNFLNALLRNPGQRQALLQELDMPLRASKPGDGPPHGNYQVLVIDSRVFAVEKTPGGVRCLVEDIHPETVEQVREIQQKTGSMPILVFIQSHNLSQALNGKESGITGFELAPDLAQFADDGRNRELLEASADAMMDWLFPEPGLARMPIFCVTGTNGKTTVCRLIAHILEHAGYQPGLVSTDGVYLGGQRISEGDASAFIGHARVLASNKANAGVFENHHTGIAIRGFAFQKCDVGVCLNVTYDHIEPGEIESVEEMAEIKRAIPERAEKAAVLFVDNEFCREMIPHLNAEEIGLVSIQSPVTELRDLVDESRGRFCVLETIEDKEWMVLYSETARLPLLPVNDIPATFGGTARFMVSNAMHAAIATWRFGISPDDIADALRLFVTGPETTPGRLNVYDELPFRVIADFAHNADGMQKICDFSDRQQVAGRKILAFSGSVNRTEACNRLCAAALAGHFNFYYIKEYQERSGDRTTVQQMRSYLVEEGVEADAIGIPEISFGKEAVFEILDNCKPGDLLIYLAGTRDVKNFDRYIREYLSGSP